MPESFKEAAVSMVLYNIAYLMIKYHNLKRIPSNFISQRRRERRGLEVICKLSTFFLFIFIIKQEKE
jgi:hypothetical protein